LGRIQLTLRCSGPTQGAFRPINPRRTPFPFSISAARAPFVSSLSSPFLSLIPLTTAPVSRARQGSAAGPATPARAGWRARPSRPAGTHAKDRRRARVTGGGRGKRQRTPLPLSMRIRGGPGYHRGRHLPRDGGEPRVSGGFPPRGPAARIQKGRRQCGLEARLTTPLGVFLHLCSVACPEWKEKAGAPLPRRAVGGRSRRPCCCVALGEGGAEDRTGSQEQGAAGARTTTSSQGRSETPT
jgi:hypothetical protein